VLGVLLSYSSLLFQVQDRRCVIAAVASDREDKRRRTSQASCASAPREQGTWSLGRTGKLGRTGRIAFCSREITQPLELRADGREASGCVRSRARR
jgi:hypothetical protein